MTRSPPAAGAPAGDDPDAAKTALREEMAGIRAEAAARHPGAADRLGEAFGEFRDGDGFPDGTRSRPVVAGYWPIRTEVSPLPLMGDLAGEGLATALPVTPEPGGVLAFRPWRQGDALVEGPYGTSEPAPEALDTTPDILLVPLLAFDDGCRRLGYGGGFYDRTIAALRARNPGTRALGLAYAEQRVDRLPVEAHDEPLDAVLTPGRLFRRAGAGSA